MATALRPYDRIRLPVDQAQKQQIQGAVASPFLVFNTDLTVAQTYPLDPRATVADTSANGLRAVVLKNGEGPFIDLCAAWSGNTDPTVAPIVRAYGLLPTGAYRDGGANSDFFMPADVDVAFPVIGNDHWRPLPDLTGNYALTLSIVRAMKLDVSGTVLSLGGFRLIPTLGTVKQVIVCDTAGAAAAKMLALGCILATP